MIYKNCQELIDELTELQEENPNEEICAVYYKRSEFEESNNPDIALQSFDNNLSESVEHIFSDSIFY